MSALIGRAAELRTLTDTLAEVLSGTARVVLLEGEPGVGKSRLLAATLEQLDGRLQVLRGGGHELERERPFGIVADALGLAPDADGDPALTEIGRLLDVEVAHDTTDEFAELRYDLVEAILAHLRERAAVRPTLLALEDVHWADPSTILVVHHVARRLSDLPIGVVATLRPVPRPTALEQLQRGLPADVGHHLRLGPLTDDTVDELATTLLHRRPGPRLRGLLAGAAGNPFFVTELVAAMAERGGLVTTGDLVDVDGEVDAPSLRTTILGRLAFLPRRCSEILQVAAVLGSRFSPRDLAIVTGITPVDLVRMLEEVRRSGLLVDEGRQLAFRHHLVWDAVYHDLPLASREAVHLQVARALVAGGGPPLQIATHFLAGAARGDEDAVSWLAHAARDALARAPSVAVDLLTGAIELTGDEGVQQRLAVDLATALTWSGRLQEAERLLTELVADLRGTQVAAEVRLGLARTLIIQGKATAAAPHYPALTGPGGLTGAQRARALTDAAIAALLSGDIAAARAASDEALAEGRRTVDDPAICGALSAASWLTAVEGRTAEAVRLGEEATLLATTSPVRDTARRYPQLVLGVTLMDADRIDEGRRMFDTGRRIAESFGDSWQLPIHHLGAALADFHEGRLSDAVVALETADEALADVGTAMLNVWAYSLGAAVAIHRDELRQAADLLTAAEEVTAEAGPGLGYDWLLWGRARLAEASGDDADAVAGLRSAWELAAALGYVSQRRLIGVDLVRLLLATDDHDAAASVTEAMEVAADLAQVDGARVCALRCRGVVDADPAVALAAVDLAARGPRPLALAGAHEDAGLVLARAGARDDAVTNLDRAAEVFGDCGAVRDARRVDAALRDLGVRRRRGRASDRPATGWQALTPTEVQVARLAAEGLTNPAIGRQLFVSPRTVETHLTHVYAKLGLTSRVELAAAMVAGSPP